MNSRNDEEFFIKKAKLAQTDDPYTAKAWILSAKTLFPNNFSIQFEAYLQEKAAKNYLEAAKCFNYIVLTFQKQPPELWQEIAQLTTALRVPEEKISKDDDFYVQMFQHISYDVQNKILSNLNTDNNLDHCKFVLLLMKKFPQATKIHMPRLIDTLLQSNAVNQEISMNMLIHDVIPLILNKPPDLPVALAQRLMSLTLEYYVPQLFFTDTKGIITIDLEDSMNNSGSSKLSVTTCWKRIFEIMELCGRMMKWEKFLPYNVNWSKDVYWQKLIQIVSLTSGRSKEKKQILFYTTILFIMSLQNYINKVKQKIDDIEVRYILIEGLKDTVDTDYDPHRMYIEPPHLMVNPPLDNEVAISFRTAVQCWQLLHSNEILQMDFKQLLIFIPYTNYISPFLIDLAFYAGRPDDGAILHDSSLGTLEKNLRYLSLTLHQPNFQIQTFDFLMKILPDLPAVNGVTLREVSTGVKGRHCLFLPLTKRAILQYCTKIIINALKPKLYNGTKKCSDAVLGNLLVLLQLNWPAEYQLAELIFDHIRAKSTFILLNFSNYIICTDLLEEFMNVYLHDADVRLELMPPQASTSQRRIGTRNVDKGIKDDFKQLIRKQFLRVYDDLDALIVQFITQEHMCLVQNIFEK